MFKIPVAPPNCKTLLTEYIELAKTRLCDLGEAPVMGLFDFEMVIKLMYAFIPKVFFLHL